MPAPAAATPAPPADSPRPSGVPAGAHATALRARYAETDAMGVVHHAVYPVWFEVGRSDLMRALGLPYAEVEARGFYLMLTGLEVHYRRAARYDEALTLWTWLGDLRSRTLTFGYRLYGPGGDPLSDGQTRHIVTDHSYRPQRLPAEVAALLQREAAPPREAAR